jgi:hypothetical protein
MSQHRKLKGLAFDIADLRAIQSGAEYNGVRMDIRLDHGAEDEEYEEVIGFHIDSSTCSLLLWRNHNTGIAQRMSGRQLHFPSISAALGRLYVKPSVPGAP